MRSSDEVDGSVSCCSAWCCDAQSVQHAEPLVFEAAFGLWVCSKDGEGKAVLDEMRSFQEMVNEKACMKWIRSSILCFLDDKLSSLMNQKGVFIVCVDYVQEANDIVSRGTEAYRYRVAL